MTALRHDGRKTVALLTLGIPVALLLLGSCPDQARAASPLPAVPARGIVDLDEGALEFWMQLQFDPWPDDLQPGGTTYRGWATVIGIETGDPVFNTFLDLWLFTKIDRYEKMHLRFRIGLLGAGSGGTAFMPFPQNARAGNWYHCAVTWARDAWALFRDGECVGRGPRSMDFDAAMTDRGVVRLGSVKGRSGRGGPVVVDELRISTVARPASALGFHDRLSPDLFASLLWSFDQAGELDENVLTDEALAEGKHGRGLDLRK